MQLARILKPGLMISQVHPESRQREGETLRTLENALALGFFQAFQTVDVPYPSERKKIAQRIKENGLAMTYSLARIVYESRLNLASMDSALRRESVARIITGLEGAREQGAQFVQFVSGPAPVNPEHRGEALSRLNESLLEVCRAARYEPKLTVLIEPLDVFAHKKGALGYTKEAVALVKALRREADNVGLCLDTAHMMLNGENVAESLKSARDETCEIHFCNCITDVGHPLYGDHHIPFGPPGVLDIEGIAAVLFQGHEIGFFSETKHPGAFCEVFNKSGDIEGAVSDCIQNLQAAEKTFQSMLEQRK